MKITSITEENKGELPKNKVSELADITWVKRELEEIKRLKDIEDFKMMIERIRDNPTIPYSPTRQYASTFDLTYSGNTYSLTNTTNGWELYFKEDPYHTALANATSMQEQDEDTQYKSTKRKPYQRK